MDPEAAQVVPLLDRVREGEHAPATVIEVPFGGDEAVDGSRHYRASLSPILENDGSPRRHPRDGRGDHRGGPPAPRPRARAVRERRVAEQLQRTLLPDALPDIAGIEVLARYEPAGDGGFVGGDWYDVFDAGDGRVAIAVGDVAGRGLQAATVMGQLRAALRAYAIADPGRRG